MKKTIYKVEITVVDDIQSIIYSLQDIVKGLKNSKACADSDARDIGDFSIPNRQFSGKERIGTDISLKKIL